MSLVTVALDGKIELAGTLTEMTVNHQHPGRFGGVRRASVELSLVLSDEPAKTEEPRDAHADVRGWRGPVGFSLVIPQEHHECVCCGKVIKPLKLHEEKDRTKRQALRRTGTVARWILPGGAVGAAMRFAHPKCLAAIRDRTSAAAISAGTSSAYVAGSHLNFPEGLNFAGQDLEDSPAKTRQEACIKKAVARGASKESAWKDSIQEMHDGQVARVRRLLEAEEAAEGFIKPRKGDVVSVLDRLWCIQSLEGSSALLCSDDAKRHLRLDVSELTFVTRPNVVFTSPVKYSLSTK